MRPVWSLDNSLNNLTEQVPVQKFRVYSREVLLLPLNNWQECNELKQEKDFFKEATSIGFDSSWRPVAISFTYKVYFSLPVPKNWISTMSFLPSDNGSMLSLWHTSTICRLYNHRGSTKMRNLEISPWLWWWWQIVAKAIALVMRFCDWERLKPIWFEAQKEFPSNFAIRKELRSCLPVVSSAYASLLWSGEMSKLPSM